MSYRLSAEAEAVRIRYPEGVSTTADASLTLTGSSNRSLLAGQVTIRKSGFNMKQDLGSIITGSANPIPVPATQNAFLRNLQFDIRVRTSPNATFQTSYTRDLQTRADLRLRGSPAKPVILGSVEVNQCEVLFFGNQYTISRGELLFFNTAVIQPSINLDLETRIRGVTVYLNVSGPLSRLDVNYRSEPPLQSQEILALLTVGRAPTATSSTIPASISSRSSVLGESNANTLLGGALSASVSSRVQKFFGACGRPDLVKFLADNYCTFKEKARSGSSIHSFDDPELLIKTLEQKRELSAVIAEIILLTGARIHEVRTMRIEGADIIIGKGKGGKKRVLDFSFRQDHLERVTTLAARLDDLSEGIDWQEYCQKKNGKYQAHVRLAACELEDEYQGAHGLRANYARNLRRILEEMGLEPEQMEAIITRDLGHERRSMARHYLAV